MNRLALDARNIPCPRPLLKTKEALENEAFEILEIRVNNSAARENVCRFLKKSGMENVDWQDNGDGEWLITASRPTTEEAPFKDGSDPAPPASFSKKTILIGSDRIGRGNDELGALLMKGYLYTLTQLENPPENLIFMNSGIYLTCEGSESLKDLEELSARGCRILVCGTCLDFLKQSEKCCIGTVSNMYEIAGLMTDQTGTVSLV